MPIQAQRDFSFNFILNFIVGGGGGGELSCLNRKLGEVLKQSRSQGLSS